jgi:hypothetical protein
MVPSDFLLTLYTHLQSMIFFPSLAGTRCHGSCIAFFQSACPNASVIFSGSPVSQKFTYLIMPSNNLTGFRILFCRLVTGLEATDDRGAGSRADPPASAAADGSDPDVLEDSVWLAEACGEVAPENSAAEDPAA